jgi:HPr kinase/phosphorylase
MADGAPTLHASAVLVGSRAALIRGPSGSGKSHLALALLREADAGVLQFARLVADDRAHAEACHGRLIVRPAPVLAGLLEVRGLGLRRLPYEAMALVGLVVDLEAADAARLPLAEADHITLDGVTLPRLAIAAGADPLPIVCAHIATTEA